MLMTVPRISLKPTMTMYVHSLTLHCKLVVSPCGPIYKTSCDLSYDYLKFIVRLVYDSDLQCAEISLHMLIYKHCLMIVQVNRT